MSLRLGELLIHDTTDNDKLFPAAFGRGAVPRDFGVDPPEMFADPPSEMALIPESEWDARYDEMVATKSFLSDILLAGDNGKPIPSLNQGQWGYCWAHSVTGCNQAIRALRGAPYIPLSAFSVAATIKNGRNEGGWCGLSAKFIEHRGQCTQEDWPQLDARLSHGTAAAWNHAGHFKLTETWMDLAKPEYAQVLTDAMIMTCLFNRVPVACDFNWWGHSVLICDPVRVERGSWGKRGRNSWGDGYGDRGFFTLQGSRARADNAIAVRSSGLGIK